MFTMDVRGVVPWLTRTWFGRIFFGCWGALSWIKIACEGFGWSREGPVYWLVAGPVLVGYIAAGVPWVVLVVRDFLSSPRHFWNELRSTSIRDAQAWVLTVVAGLALGAGLFALKLMLT